MSLPYSDPSNPALPSPLFSDVTAVRADHMRANNAAIFADLEYLSDLFDEFFTVSDQLTVDEILEKTTDAGVTIDGLTIKDGAIAEDLFVRPGATTARLYLQTTGSGSSGTDGFRFVLSDSGYAIIELFEERYLSIFTNAVERLRLAASTPKITVANNARDLVNSSGYVVADKQRETGTGAGILNTKIIEIGDWDMDSTWQASVAHGLTFAKIRKVEVWVRTDANDGLFNLVGIYSTTFETSNCGGSVHADATYIRCTRTTNGYFDNTSFDSTSYNRGWITIEYVD